MKVFFIPNYFYLNLSVFEAIIKNLKEKGIVSYILRLPGMTSISADASFNHEYFESQNLNLIEPPILRVPNYRKGFLPKLRFLISSFRNLREIRKFLEQHKPDVVVVGSDLGNLNVRFLMDACHYHRIPIVILYSCDVPQPNKKNILRFLYSCKRKYFFRSRILSFLKALFFTGTTPGAYALNSTICVTSKDIYNKVVSGGIDNNRIIVTGMPFMSTSFSDTPEHVFEDLNISKDYRLIVLFTERIQDIYGITYSKKLYTKLGRMVENLPADIFFLIKLHPREDKEMVAFIKESFSDFHCKIIANINAEKLIGIADLCIAHFSRTLIMAALMGRRILSINLRKDRKRTFVLPEETDIEIQSEEELLDKILRALSDPSWQKDIDKLIAGIANRFQPQSMDDGISKATSVILEAARD